MAFQSHKQFNIWNLHVFLPRNNTWNIVVVVVNIFMLSWYSLCIYEQTAKTAEANHHLRCFCFTPKPKAMPYKSIIYLWPMSMNWSRWCSNHHLCANTVSWPKSCIFRCLKSARHHQPLRQCENKESWSRRKILKFQDLVKIWQDFWQQHTLMSLAGSYDNILEQLEPLLRSD